MSKMVADCGATIAKYILCLFNFVCFISGSVILCLGIWLAVDKTSFIQLTRFSTLNHGTEVQKEVKGIVRELTEPTVIEQGAYILIGVGAFIFIISFLGYCGAVKESRFLLTAYALFIIIISLLQIVAIVLATIYKSSTESTTLEFFSKTLNKYYTTKERRDAVTLSWDFMMAELQCCGVKNSEDFRSATEFLKYIKEDGKKQILPESCCKLDPSVDIALFKPADDNCITAPTVTNSYMNNGCYDHVHGWVISNLNTVIGIAIAIIGLQILAIIFAFCLCKSIGSDRDIPYKY